MSRHRVGDAQVRKSVQQPKGRFALRTGLAAAGAISLLDAQVLVFADWARQVAAGTIGAGVIGVYSGDVKRLVRYLAALGVTEVRSVTADHVLTWMHAANARGVAPAESSVTRRMAAARAFFKTCHCLGLHNINPAYGVTGGKGSKRVVSALRPQQIAHLKTQAPFRLGETKTPAALALLLCGATSREAAYVRVMDVDLAAGMVWLHNGGERTRARWVAFPDQWVADALTTRITHLTSTIADPAALAASTVAYETNKPRDNPVRRQAAVAMTITNLMDKARIYQPGQTRVESIRETVAAQLFAQHGCLATVANMLGMSSLDAIAHIVGYDWTNVGIIDRPAPTDPITAMPAVTA